MSDISCRIYIRMCVYNVYYDTYRVYYGYISKT